MTSSVHYRFIEPLDVLFLRGNKLFGDPGSYGESLMPPWPSVAAGAIRSAMLARDGVDLQAFAAGQLAHPALGTPASPGPFAIAGFTLARVATDGQVESLHALPADLVAEAGDDGKPVRLQRLVPTMPAPGLSSSAPLAQWPVLPQSGRSKPAANLWLTQAGWSHYLAGETPGRDQLVTSDQLWAIDRRVGIGLDAGKRSAADGQLFTVQAVAFKLDVGFLAAISGAEPPADGLLRFGGDGRAAAIRAARHHAAAADLAAIARAGRVRIVLTTPGLFAEGWRLPGTDDQQHVRWPGLSARLACAAVGRADVVSGWDLARRQPKPAERFAPTGSVYWLEDIETTPEALGKLAEEGLAFGDAENAQRRAEGFNRYTYAAW